MRTFVFIPPVHKPTGGVAVLLHVVEHLRELGHEAWAVPREGKGLGYYGSSAVPVTPWDTLDLRPEDVWLAPEGWVNALAPGLAAGARCVAYVQNWAYLFSSLPPGATWAQLPVSFLAVSHPVARFVEQATGRSAPILRPHVDPAVFRAPGAKARDVVNVAYMPRKNKALVDQIRALCASRARPGCPAVNWIPIQGTDHHGVAELLRAAHIFLATGFPEGCPLPPLEAMACGCLVVGFPGLGGWDYMRQVPRESGSRGAAPWFPLRDVSWSGNGFWAADGDVLDAALALEEAVRWWTEQPPRLAETLANGQAAAAQYTPEHQRAALDDLWQRAADGELFPPARR